MSNPSLEKEKDSSSDNKNPSILPPIDNKLKENNKSPEKTLSKSPNNRSGSLSPTSKKDKPKKFTYLNQRVTIPNLYSERIDYILSLFKDEEMAFTVQYAPLYKTSSSVDLGKYFKSKQKYIVEIAASIVFYFYKTFLIDKNVLEYSNTSGSLTNRPSSPKKLINSEEKSADDILHSGQINSAEELCILFREICGNAGVNIKIINGLLKKPDYKIGDSLVKHKWCLINCSIDKDYLIDPLLIIGTINSDNEFEKDLKPFYFLTPPNYFLEDHLPDNEKYQFNSKTIKVKEFTKKTQIFTETFYYGIYKYQFQLINYTEPEINCKDSEIVIKFNVKDLDLDCDCVLNGKKVNEENIKLSETGLSNQYQIFMKFPSNGEYKLSIYGKPVGTTGDREFIFNYRISVKIINIIKHEDPKKKTKSPSKKILTTNISNLCTTLPPITNWKRNGVDNEVGTEKKLTKCFSDFDDKVKMKCYDSNGAHLFEPKTKFIRISQEVKFKVRIRKAKYVVVLDGRKWNYLKKKEDDIYEGIVPITNENVVICAMRNNNVYTEVYEFLAVKR